jgi:hypothetical protein
MICKEAFDDTKIVFVTKSVRIIESARDGALTKFLVANF